MRTILSGILLLITFLAAAQRNCVSSPYIDHLIRTNPGLEQKLQEAEHHARLQARGGDEASLPILRIPVVVHIVYKRPEQNISDDQVRAAIEALNRDFRRRNPDTVNTPLRFQQVAADVQIEFVLASADPQGRPTTGIVRKQTAVEFWRDDDKIKFTKDQGQDAWDSRSYLNIWVGNLMSILGYASVPGAPVSTDGIVINYSVFGNSGSNTAFNMDRTLVHEAGHWLGLKHIWGDFYCGDDGVDDTPVQGNFTPGCPNAFRSSCNNGNLGDMYMNYMDYTNDACMNLFTDGQKARMRAHFLGNGARQSLLVGRGLNQPWNFTAPEASILPESVPVKLFPVPARDEIFIETGVEWNGSIAVMINAQGAVVSRFVIVARKQSLPLSSLKPGVYFIQANRGGEAWQQKFIKL